MYTHVLLITLLIPCCMSERYAIFNDECTDNTVDTMSDIPAL